MEKFRAYEKNYINNYEQDVASVNLYVKADGDALCYDAAYKNPVPAEHLMQLVVKQLAIIHYHNSGTKMTCVPVAFEETSLSDGKGVKVHCITVASTVCTGCTFVSKEDKEQAA